MPIRIVLFLCLSSPLAVQCWYQNNMTDCKTHVAQSSNYIIFHEIENDRSSRWFLFDLHFSILAKSDAHVLISDTKNICNTCPVYEIVLGAGSNTFSDIRRGLKTSLKVRKSTVNILSSTVYRSFWIRIWTGCKTHVANSSQYSVFHEIENDQRSSWFLFELRFSVLAKSDAHILISETKNISKSTPVYEIVLGAGLNTFSDIRRGLKSLDKVRKSTVNILSSTVYRSFWIRIWTDYLIEVGNEGNNTAFLAWKDENPLKLKYFSFASWGNIYTKWFYDCKEKINEPNSNNIILPNIEKDDRLPSFQKLKRDLFQNYSIFIRPVLDENSTTDVSLYLIPQYVSLDERTSKLNIKGLGRMQWIDEKLKWYPKNYSDIDTIKLSDDDIWTPDLRLYDQKISAQDIFLYYNGSVSANILLNANYWCNMEDLTSWPFDTHNCSLKLMFDNDHGKIRWLYLSQEKEFFKQPGLASEWIVVNSKLDTNFTLVWDEYGDYDDDSTSSLVLLLTLKRLSSVYKLIFLPPFFVISICCLCTFWAPAFGYQKIFLGCLQLIIESSILIYISSILPGHSSKVPTLIGLYSSCLIGTTISIIVSIIVINISRNKHINTIPECLRNILISNCLQQSLFLPRIQNENDEIYNPSTDNTTKNYSNQEIWILLGTVIDRITFFIYVSLFIFAIFYNVF